MRHPAAAHGSVVVDGRAAGRSVVVGGGGADQRPLGFVFAAVGVVVFDDVILSAEQGDDGWSTKTNTQKKSVESQNDNKDTKRPQSDTKRHDVNVRGHEVTNNRRKMSTKRQ